MGQIICQHVLNFHSYADDIQIYIIAAHSICIPHFFL